jgi:nitroimidazol reductase NimA-like FMN-containing flavoprotein (pyridoxamine 5'-phosphate oxidase superfamily)
MFRTMRRIKQQLSEEECIRILQEEKRGVLSMHGEDGYPYGIPMNHWYNPEDGKLYFHGAKTGHKTDAIAKDNRVSYCVHDAGYRKEGEWALNISSVVVFGRISPVTDEEKAKLIGINLCRKFTDDEAYIQRELQNALPRAQCLELTIDHMTGKLVNES